VWEITIAESAFDEFNFLSYWGSTLAPTEDIRNWCDKYLGEKDWYYKVPEDYQGSTHWLATFGFYTEGTAEWFMIVWGEKIKLNSSEVLMRDVLETWGNEE